MKLRFTYIFVMLISLGLLSACEKDAPEVEYTATYPVSGEWYVRYSVETAPGNLEVVKDYTKLMTTNTAANTSSELLVTDQLSADAAGAYKTFKVKATVDVENLAFSASNSNNLATVKKVAKTNKVTILDGKVIKNGVTAASGVTTDSIYFKLQFSDDATGTTYHVAGYRRTGFLEDEHH
ncbi:lipid-binding protein [Pontibacter sp. MBLB2868]|uniref:lipid-binding protein n=1 Tax=Pontibacter sp. MBLB2868 TaxID=3451555 RepID=UPI003F74F504